jgi:HPt (histidine-containing phosphotransfer) domain-containing protein
VTSAELLNNLWAAQGQSLVPSAEAVLECAAAWECDQADSRQLAEASHAAHGLAGALGLFGFVDLAALAGDLEDRLERIIDGALRHLDTAECELTHMAEQLVSGVRTASSVSAQ